MLPIGMARALLTCSYIGSGSAIRTRKALARLRDPVQSGQERRFTLAGEVTCAALNGARLAHVAAHGRFRSDNPLSPASSWPTDL